MTADLGDLEVLGILCKSIRPIRAFLFKALVALGNVVHQNGETIDIIAYHYRL